MTILHRSSQEIVKVNLVTTKQYTIALTNGELQQFFKDFMESISSNNGEICLETMKSEYNFVIIPSGSGSSTTNRENINME